jgi:hypothetical protein
MRLGLSGGCWRWRSRARRSACPLVFGLLVLMGVSAETAIIDVSYIDRLRLEA